MTDQHRLDPAAPAAATAPIAAPDDARRDPFGDRATTTDPANPGPAATAGPSPAAAFTGRTARKTDAIRAGVLVGTGLVVAMGAAVAMGASPSPATSGGAAPAASSSADPGTGDPGRGPRGGGFGPFGAIGPNGPGGEARGFGGPGREGVHRFGQISVTAVSGSNVSLATEDGWTRTITVTGSTTITKGGAAATLADLAVGDVVRFAETRNTDGTFAITKLEIVQPQVAGTVTAVGADTITITLRDGTSASITTTGSTTYHVEDAGGKRSDVTVGSTIMATGERATDGSLTASSVWVRLPHVAGTVKAVGSDGVTITRPDGTTVTVHVAADTTIRVAGVDSAKLSDIKAGMVVIVEGTQRSDGSIDAREIGAGDRGLGKGFGNGHDKAPGPDASAAPSASGSSDG